MCDATQSFVIILVILSVHIYKTTKQNEKIKNTYDMKLSCSSPSIRIVCICNNNNNNNRIEMYIVHISITMYILFNIYGSYYNKIIMGGLGWYNIISIQFFFIPR